MIPTRRPSNDKPQAINSGGLSGLSHVDRKNPTPRPAPTTMLNPPNANLTNGTMGGLGMTTNQIRSAHPPNTSPRHVTEMKKHMNQGANFSTAHMKAEQQGFPAKRRGLGMSMPSSKTLGFVAMLGVVGVGSAYYYRRRSIKDAFAEEEDDSE